MRLTLHVGWFAMLLISGLAVGVIAGRAWGDVTRQREAEGRSRTFARRSVERRRALDSAFGPSDSKSRRIDSTVKAWRGPTEWRRTQAGAHCAFSFVMADSVDLQLFNVRAHDARTMNSDAPPVIGQGFAYSESGFRPMDTVTVVVPYIDCSASVTMALGFASVLQRQPLRLIPR